ncbi:MAG: hypothetical protein JW997_06150, partial [Actinobacteria bacterium]|nr:hypothetical protein [Actinomycetota bacterium]
CKKCGNTFEKLQKMGSASIEVCEICKSEAVRVFLPAGIIFKGSGFYTTDYKSGSSKANINTNTAKEEKKEAPAAQENAKSAAPAENAPKPAAGVKGEKVKA